MKVLIKSADASFRRAGMQFTREGVVVDPAELTEAQRDAITNEPRLSLSPVDDEPNDDGKAGGGGSGSGGGKIVGGKKAAK